MAILRRIFQPKWQSRNPDTRLEAVGNLLWEQEEQRTILLKLAETDPDTRVSQRAIEKIAEPDALLKLLARPGGAHQTVILTQLAGLLDTAKGTTEQLRQLSGQLQDDEQRYQLILNLKSIEARLALLEQLNNQRHLADLAMHASASRLRQQAVDQLQDYELLEEVLKASKNKDKGVYQTAKAKLTQHREEEKRLQQEREHAQELCASLEAHATSEATHLYQAKFDALANQWQQVQKTADQDLVSRAERAINACRERIRQREEEERQQAEAAQHHSNLQQEREATCATLEETLDALRQAPQPNLSNLTALDALIKTQENRWLEATRDVPVEKAEQKRYQQAMHLLRGYLAALQKYASREKRLQELLTTCQAAPADESPAHDELRELRQLQGEIEWPDEFSTPALLGQVREHLGHLQDLRKQQTEDNRKLRREIDKTIDNLEKKLEERSLKASSQLFKDLQKQLQQLPHQVEQSYQGKLKLLHGRLQELRDWQGFVTQPKQIELCERMEHLAEQHLDPQIKANRIKELQAEWRALGGSSDQALWSRFKTASDKAYEPCQEFFVEQERLKQANLEKRQEIRDHLQTFLNQVNWENVDWKAMDRISRKAREEWHQFYPVDHKQNKPLQKQFQKLMDALEGHLNEERARNAALKAEIVARAEQLVGEEDMRHAAQAAKALQKEWQAIGITEHREDRKLWKAFRAACDQIFAKLDDQRSHHQREVQEQITQAEQLCTEAEQLVSKSGDELEARLPQIQQEFKSLQLPREAHQKLQERFQTAIQAARQHLRHQQQQQAMQQWRELAQQAEAVARHEDAIIAGEPHDQPVALKLPEELPPVMAQQLGERLQNAEQASAEHYERNERSARLLAIQAEIAAGLESPESERALRMEYQMERLSEGLTGGQSKQSAQEEVISILASWYGLGPVEPRLRVALQKRLEQALLQIM